jgi:putative transposase
LVDHLGLISEVVVSAANCNDRDGLQILVDRLRIKGHVPQLIYADQGYTGDSLKSWMKDRGIKLEIVKRAQGICIKDGSLKTIENFVVLPKRWIVERTFAWLGRFRRLSKDYEYYPSTSETFIYLGMTKLMLRRISEGNFDF